jgi:phosphatidylglycerophosphate synthase
MFRWNSIPNLISYSRIFFIGTAVLIPAFKGANLWWCLGLWLYLLGWFTDALDGWAAKWIGNENKYGAKVDKTCDCISLIILLMVFHIYELLPKHFYYTLWALMLWIPRYYYTKYRPQNIVGGIVEALQMIYFIYLIFFFTLFYSEKAYGHIPIEYRLAVISMVAIILVFIKRERLIGIVKEKLTLRKTPT